MGLQLRGIGSFFLSGAFELFLSTKRLYLLSAHENIAEIPGLSYEEPL